MNFKLGKNLFCHKGDSHLFIEHSGGYTSIHFIPFEMTDFINLLSKSLENKKYVSNLHNFNKGPLTFELEDEDEGTRNICISNGGLYLAINVKVKVIPELISFLKKEWNV